MRIKFSRTLCQQKSPFQRIPNDVLAQPKHLTKNFNPRVIPDALAEAAYNTRTVFRKRRNH